MATLRIIKDGVFDTVKTHSLITNILDANTATIGDLNLEELKVSDGTVLLPSISFTNASDTGLYLINSTGILGISADGKNQIEINGPTNTINFGNQASSILNLITGANGTLNLGVGTSTVVLNGSTVTLGNTGGSTVTMGNATSTTNVSGSTVNLGNTGGSTVTTGNATSTTNVSGSIVRLGNTGSSDVRLGNTTGTTTTNIYCGSNGLNIDGITSSNYAFGLATTTGTMVFGGTAQTGSISMGISTVGQTLNLLNTINTQPDIINIASAAAGANTTVNILSGATTSGTQTLNIMATAAVGGTRAVNIATGSDTTSIIGNTTGVSALHIRGGTGSVTRTTNVGSINPVTVYVDAADARTVLRGILTYSQLANATVTFGDGVSSFADAIVGQCPGIQLGDTITIMIVNLQPANTITLATAGASSGILISAMSNPVIAASTSRILYFRYDQVSPAQFNVYG